MSPLYRYQGVWPTLGARTFIAPSADILGDVVLGDDCGVWFRSVVRGDVNVIRIGDRTNVQDGAVLHVTTETFPLHIGSGVTIGHGAVVHGCTVRDNCLIGIGAVVLDGATIGEGSIVGAGALVTEGQEIPSGHLVLGVPARPFRAVNEAERRRILRNAEHYVREKDKYLRELDSTSPGKQVNGAPDGAGPVSLPAGGGREGSTP